MFNKKKYAIGLDIGAHYTKIAILEYKDLENGIKIHSLKQKVTPLNIIVNGEIVDKIKMVEFLTEFIREMPIDKNTFIAISLNMMKKNANIKNIVLLDLKKKEMRQAIEELIEDELGIGAKNDIYYNWQKQNKKDKTHSNVLIAGIKKINIDSIIETLAELNVKPYYIEPTGLSILRNLKLNKIDNKIIIDIGGSYINILGVKNKALVYSRIIEIGTHNILNKIIEYIDQNNLKVEDETIDIYFNDLLASIIEIKQSILNSTGHAKQIFKIIEQETELIIDQIIETIDFFQNHYNINTNQLFLTGGPVQLNYLIKILEEYSNKKIIQIKPYFWQYLSENEKEIYKNKINSFIPAIGVALKEVEDNV